MDLTGPWASPCSSSSAPALPRASSPTLTPVAKELVSSQASGDDEWHPQTPASLSSTASSDVQISLELIRSAVGHLLSCAAWSPGGGVTFSMTRCWVCPHPGLALPQSSEAGGEPTLASPALFPLPLQAGA